MSLLGVALVAWPSALTEAKTWNPAKLIEPAIDVPVSSAGRAGSHAGGNPKASIKATFAIHGVLGRHASGRATGIGGHKQLLEEM